MKRHKKTGSNMPATGSRNAENELVSGWKRNEKKAFDKLYQHFRGWVLGLALQILRNLTDAEDVTQDVFLKILRHGDKFKEGTNFRAWITRITLNTALNMTRRKYFKSRPEEYDERTHQEAWMNTRPNDDDALGLLMGKEARRIIEAEIDKLPPKRRELIILCDVEGRSYLEAGKITGVPVGTIMSRLFRGRQKLREELPRNLLEK